MCWVFWYKWKWWNANKKLILWLQKLEYRWYDSAWLIVWNEKTWETKALKSIWKVANLSSKCLENISSENEYNFWIAHTRWATHWGITEENTHPHYDSKENIFLVHNWIIENVDILKKQLITKWYEFYSDTDSEVIAKLIEDNRNWNFLESVEKTLPLLEWAYAILIISKNDPWSIIWVKYWSPLVFWYTNDSEMIFASDINALWWFAKDVIYLDDWDLVYVKNNDFIVKSEWKLAIKPTEKINLENLEIDKWDYEHFMLKEIFEQPSVIKDVFRWRINQENYKLNSAAFQRLDKEDFDNIIFIACWTSYNAWVIWTYRFEDLAWMQAKAEIASEYEYRNIVIDPKTLYIFISQSWETADSIECLNMIKNKWWKTLWIVNVVWSTISRLTDFWFFTRAWIEVWVASTKAYISQITTIMLLVLYFWRKKWMNTAQYNKIASELLKIPEYIQEIFDNTANIKKIAKSMKKYKNFFFLWKHYQYPVALESSLKLKEISYLHSEAYPWWELKHWPLALIDENFPTILFIPNDLLYDKNMSTFKEISARKWKVVTITDKEIDKNKWNIKIPSTIWELYPFLTSVVWQLFAYYMAKELWREIDKPRNLAKSVTVK